MVVCKVQVVVRPKLSKAAAGAGSRSVIFGVFGALPSPRALIPTATCQKILQTLSTVTSRNSCRGFFLLTCLVPLIFR